MKEHEDHILSKMLSETFKEAKNLREVSAESFQSYFEERMRFETMTPFSHLYPLVFQEDSGLYRLILQGEILDFPPDFSFFSLATGDHLVIDFENDPEAMWPVFQSLWGESLYKIVVTKEGERFFMIFIQAEEKGLFEELFLKKDLSSSL